MSTARVQSAALTGITGHIITIDADICNGPPGIVLAGLPETMLREARDRVRAAVINSSEIWPEHRIAVALSPAALPKRGSGTDLAMAVAVLAANGSVPARSAAGMMLFAELGLDGLLRPVPGTVPAVIASAEAGLSTVVVAEANAAEAALVPGVRVLTADRLAAVTGWLRTGDPALIRETPPTVTPAPRDDRHPDLADVPGSQHARQALEVSAAGGHHLSLTGPQGSGGALLARCLPGILPRLDDNAALEVASIRSAAGLLASEEQAATNPPFIAPHHTSSKAAIVGGGSGSLRPGAASLAHRGVLFLDQAPEFSRDVLDGLRQPLETGQITVVRHGVTATLPAQFTLVLTARPCACTDLSPAGCGCSVAERRRYLGRVSGPLLDRIDIKAAAHTPDPAGLRASTVLPESSAAVAARVLAARDRAAWRLAGTPWRLNAHIPAAELRNWALSSGTLRGLERAVEVGQVSARAAIKIIRVAWTLADLAGTDRPSREDCQTALRLWLGVAP
jgi:magnesium chelatase family protein